MTVFVEFLNGSCRLLHFPDPADGDRFLNKVQENIKLGVERIKYAVRYSKESTAEQSITDAGDGWIEINSEKDLPDDVDAIYWVVKNSNINVIELKSPFDPVRLYNDFKADKITHYQPIIKPKPPTQSLSK